MPRPPRHHAGVPRLPIAGSRDVLDAGRDGLPTTEAIHALETQGSLAYAGTDDGVYISIDRGSRWSLRTDGPRVTVQAMLLFGNILTVATRDGVLVTRSRQGDWRHVVDGLADPNVGVLARRGTITYAGTQSRGVFMMRDGGWSWAPMGEGLPEGTPVFDLEVRGVHLYAALHGTGSIG